MKRILFVVSEVGYTWDEIILPYIEFTKQKFIIDMATPRGKAAQVDSYSVKILPLLNKIGAGTSSALSPKSQTGKELLQVLAHPQSLKAITPKDYQAIYVAGGHGSLFDLNKNTDLHKLILQFDAAKKPIGIICHASSTLVFIKKDNAPFLQNRKITGFPNSWERFILFIGFINPQFKPLPIWTGKELNQHATGRTLVTRIAEMINPKYTVQDRNIVSGVGPKAGGNVAKKMISLLQ